MSKIDKLWRAVGITGIVGMVVILGLAVWYYTPVQATPQRVTITASGYVIDAPNIPGQVYTTVGNITTITLR